MSSVQQCDQQCPECGKESGTYDLDCRTNEEWFICESCGWGFESTTRRFAAEILDELRRAVAGSDPSDRWPLIKSILKSLLGECREHGYPEDDSAVQQLQAWLKKEATVVTEADWKDLKALSCHRSLFALDKGDVILDTPLAKIGGKGLFVKELEQAMLDGRADICSKYISGLALTYFASKHCTANFTCINLCT